MNRSNNEGASRRQGVAKCLRRGTKTGGRRNFFSCEGGGGTFLKKAAAKEKGVLSRRPAVLFNLKHV